jgi:hypothetical protein
MPTIDKQWLKEHTVNMTPNSLSDNPWVIWPYYTGRDKGALFAHGGENNGKLLTFFSQGYAWKHIFEVVQPNDIRACTNYRVIQIREYLGEE